MFDELVCDMICRCVTVGQGEVMHATLPLCSPLPSVGKCIYRSSEPSAESRFTKGGKGLWIDVGISPCYIEVEGLGCASRYVNLLGAISDDLLGKYTTAKLRMNLSTDIIQCGTS